LTAEAAIESLWPEVEPDSGRKRLRNTLNRLRAVAPELVAREGDSLVLGPAEVDAQVFQAEVQAALERADTRSGRLAMARYRGALLPDDRYEDWAAAPRERLERLFLALVDAAASGAERAGEVDEALRCMERAIEIDPYDEHRYLRAARLLAVQGRRGAALAMLKRAERALAELGAPVSVAQRQLEAKIRA
jgi:DNA-binding SARP family transcriptional activator